MEKPDENGNVTDPETQTLQTQPEGKEQESPNLINFKFISIYLGKSLQTEQESILPNSVFLCFLIFAVKLECW
jgi:hypothetical protein